MLLNCQNQQDLQAVTFSVPEYKNQFCDKGQS